MSHMIPLPRLCIHPDIVHSNIGKMSRHAHENGYELRPHFKTHQSREIGSWFKAYNVQAITVSSFLMAGYFADQNWDEITVALPFHPGNLPELLLLGQKQFLNILISDPDVISILKQADLPDTGVFIDLDGGYGRSGFDPKDTESLSSVIEQLQQINGIHLKGFYLHAGNTYGCRSVEEVIQLASLSLNRAAIATEMFGLPLSYGDTPSCSVMDDLSPATILGPGNFVFYDLVQQQIGSCRYEDIGVGLECSVAAIYRSRGEVLVHAGAVHLSKDSMQVGGETIYGMAMGKKEYLNSDFSRPLQPVVRLSQEHGIIRADEMFMDAVKIGDTIIILPVHSCLTADCMGSYFDPFENRILDHLKGSGFRGA